MKKNMSASIIVATLIAFFITVFAMNNFGQVLEKRFVSDIYSRLTELSENNAASITSKITDQFEMMHALASYLENEDLRGEEALLTMNKTVESYDFLRCAITFPDGSFVTHDSKNIGNTLGDEYVLKGFKGISSLTGPRSAVSEPEKTVVLLTVPIRQGKEVVALLTCTYETKYLEKVFQMTSFGGKGYSYITDKSGNIISRPNLDELVYSGDNVLMFLKNSFPSFYQGIANDVKTMQSSTVLLTVDKSQKYVSYQPLGINQWYVFSITSGEVLESQLSTMLNGIYRLFGIIIAALVLLMAIIWFYIYTIRKKAQMELEKLAYYDSLTGIPNRHLFEKETRRILDAEQGEYAYVILNVNKFKIVNDIFGFAQGDGLLRNIANIISGELGKNEVCARFDADNFHILYIYTSRDELEKRMLAIAEKINEYNFDKNVPHNLSVGFGVYVIEDKSLPVSPMGDKARMALSKIKGIHSHTTYFYNNDIISQFMAEQEIENTMRGALENGEMKIYLQPKYLTQSCEVYGAETLVRWQSPKRGFIMPDAFIPLFEKNRFIIKLDMYMVESVCKMLRDWQDKHIKVIPISVNQSKACLYQPNYAVELLRILKKYNISPSLIELEVTEGAFLEDETGIIRIIEELHQSGFRVAMDDFGAGYSSLNTLQDMLVDVLKIDKNLFKESINSERGKKIVRNVVSMANDLNIEVVAEGIETKEQLDFLKEINCGAVQGFYFSRAIPVVDFERKYCVQTEETED